MAGIFDRFAALSERLVGRFDMEGTQAVMQVVTPDPDPLAPPDVESVLVDVPAVAFGVTGEMVASDPSLVVTDIRVIVAAANWPDVKVGDAVSLDGVEKAVIRVETVPAVGVVSIYKMIVR